jgi:hypothetical protein
MLRLVSGKELFDFDDWLSQERHLREQSLKRGRRLWRKHKDKPPSFWWETFGVLPEEIELLE